jgi:hypothetical protein
MCGHRPFWASRIDRGGELRATLKCISALASLGECVGNLIVFGFGKVRNA